MSKKNLSSSSEGPDTMLVDRNQFDIYLQAVFGYLYPKRYEMITATMRVIEYTEDSPDFWSSVKHFIRFASKYQSLFNEDLVMVIQNGANISDKIVSGLERKRKQLRYKYFVGPSNCFILTVKSQPLEVASSVLPQWLIHESELNGCIMIGGSYEVWLRHHSMLEICTNVFSEKQPVENVAADNNREEFSTKSSDNCLFPSFLPLIQLIQGAPKIPTMIVETGMSEGTTKVEVDCISTILGLRFMVESVLGIDLRTNEKTREPELMQVIVFDVSLDAMVNLFEALESNREKALVSIVLKRKAVAKRDEVRALRRLKECLDGNGNYKSVCDDIAKQYRLRMQHDRMRHLNAPQRPNKKYVMRILKDFGFKTEALRLEETRYQGIINQCDKELGLSGVKELLDDHIRQAEIFVMRKLYQRRTVQTVTYEAQQDLVLPSTALSSTHWREQEQNEILLPAEDLVRCFGHISLDCTKDDIEECVIKVETPRHYIEDDCYPAVALLNCPDNVPEEAAIEHLDQLYASDPQRSPVIETQLDYWKTGAIQSQLRTWNVPDNGDRYALMIKLLDKYTERNGISQPTRSTQSPVSPNTLRARLDTSNSSQKSLPANVVQCLATVEDPRKRDKIWELLSQEKYESLLLEINEHELALEGLNLLFRQEEGIIRHVFSRHSVISQLRELGSEVLQS